MTTKLEQQPALVVGLLAADAYPHECGDVELVETHISWVFLAGPFAYKVKKPLDMGFLDFTSLEKRRFFCEEEIRLNSRHAESIYLKVIPITGTPQCPQIEGPGVPFEYAVKMARFDQENLLNRQLTEGRLSAEKIERLADLVAQLHQVVARSSASDRYGTPARAHAPCMENFEQLEQMLEAPQRLQRIETLRNWTEAEYAALAPLMDARKSQGFIRECHGDLHLGNITEVDNDVMIFDGIEFNDDFRWIDVASELAFLFTDLEHRGRPDLGWRALNRYLEQTGDYGGLRLLRYYSLHRIMVRAKVDSFRLGQKGLEAAEREELERDLDCYFEQAEATLARGCPTLLLMRGPSASGKTYLSTQLIGALGAVRLRSDVERKRLFGLEPTESSDSPLGGGLYSEDANQQTFGRLLTLARHVLEAGYSAIIDATFLKRERWQPFRELAATEGYGFLILDMRTPESVLFRRIGQRSGDASEADEEVLYSQLQDYRSLDEEFAVGVESEAAMGEVLSALAVRDIGSL